MGCVALGTALGAMARYGVDAAAGAWVPTSPLGIFIVNFSGSFLIGWFSGHYSRMEGPRLRNRRLFWITGFCGGYTTFSAFAADSLAMVREGEAQVAGLYAALSIAGGIFAVWFGLSLAMRVPESQDGES